MELLWVVIVILYLVFTVMSSAKQRQRRAASQDWQEEVELTDVPASEPEPVRRYEHVMSVRRASPVPAGVAVWKKPASGQVPQVRREQVPGWVPESKPEWRRAVILSEVLQPPRAMRPYRVPVRRKG